jgi:MFS family permease
VGQLISQAADAATSLLIAQFVLFENTDGSTATRLGQTVVCAAVPLICAGPLSGFIADKFPRRQILWVGQIIRALLALGLLTCIELNARGVALVLFAASMCATRVLYTARIASIRHLVRQHELVAADSLLLLVSNIAGAAGATIGVSSLRFMHQHSLSIVVMCHLMASYVFLRIVTELGGGKDQPTSSWMQAMHALVAPKTRYAIASTSIHRFLFGVTFASIALFLDSGTAGSYAVLMGASGTGSLAGNATAEWMNEHLPRRSITILAYAISSLAVCVCIVHPTIHVMAPCVTAMTFLFQNLRVCSDATVQKNATRGAGGRIFAAYDLTYNLSFLGGLLVGLSATPHAGLVAVLATSCFMFGTGSMIFSLMNRVETSNLNLSSRETTPAATDNGGLESIEP